MAFSSLQFVCVFLPIVFILNIVLPSIKAKNAMLMIASLLFYAYGEPIYVLLMLLCTLWNYIMARAIDAKEGKVKKILLVLTCIADLGLLCVFKYTDMIIETINGIAKTNIRVTGIALPIGISFFTFQAMSYAIDVYRQEEKAEKSYARVLLYISFFPQLIAGPIVKYSDIAAQINDRHAGSEDIAKGLRRFVIGLSKKVIISNAMGMVADAVYSLESGNVVMLSAWIGAIAYMFQIYFDFSGYSDMAIGLGRMFGFSIKENFNYPYASNSMQDFWRRWHISLSTWFRTYLYIPLGGNRKGRTRTWINRLIVFFFTGLWHGASWTFVVWGLYHGLFLTLETIFPRFTKKLGFIRYLYVFLVVCIGFVFFRAETMSEAWLMLTAMFTKPVWGAAQAAAIMPVINSMFIVMLIIAAIAALPVKECIDNALANKDGYLSKMTYGFTYFASILLLIIDICMLAGGTYNPFIYFRF